MRTDPLLEQLWDSAPAARQVFPPPEIGILPAPVRRYLEHAIAPGTPLASAVRLRMHGAIKLGRWFPFTAEQVIHWGQGMIWRATVRMFGLPVSGFDRLVHREAALRWKLLGILPMMSASGADITRSAAGRVMAESVWLPSALCGDDVRWTAGEPSQPKLRLTAAAETTELAMAIGCDGRLQTINMQRWGNPGSGKFRYEPFGGFAEEERKFGGYTIPTRLRIGWYFGTERFEQDGEFFRVTVDEARFR